MPAWERASQAFALLMRYLNSEVLVVDYWLIDETAIEFCSRLIRFDLKIPLVVILSDDDNEAIKRECESVGAVFLSKSKLYSLPVILSSRIPAGVAKPLGLSFNG